MIANNSIDVWSGMIMLRTTMIRTMMTIVLTPIVLTWAPYSYRS